MRIGAYEVTSELGRGATAIVFAARGPDGQAVALKLLNAAGPVAKVASRFQREVDALRRLRHRGIVGFVEAGEHQGRPFLVTELVAGESLQDRLDRAGALTPAATIELGVALADALAHAHAEGVLHRDLKPANVLLGLDGRPRLADFGLTRDLEASFSNALTSTGAIIGSPGYWAPEQATGDREAFGPATDVWGLGATLYAALTREPPFGGSSLAEMCVATVERAAAPPSQVAPGVPSALDAVVLRCLEKAPAARHRSAAELAQALRGCQRFGRRAEPHEPGARLGLLVLAGAAAAVALVAVGVGIGLALARRSPAAAGPVAVTAPPPATAPPPPVTASPPPPEVVATYAGFASPAELEEELRRLVPAGRFDEAQRLVDGAPDAWLCEPDVPPERRAGVATARRSGVWNSRAIWAWDRGTPDQARAAFAGAARSIAAVPPGDREESLALQVVALLTLERADEACDAVAACPTGLRRPEVLRDLLSSLASLCPALRQGPWVASPDPAGAEGVARVLARAVATEPGLPALVHLTRARAERGRGDAAALDAALRDALAAVKPEELDVRLECAEWLLARARRAEAAPLLEELAALPPDATLAGQVGRRARLLRRLVGAERAAAAGDAAQASALFEGLLRDVDVGFRLESRPDTSFAFHVADRKRLVDADPRAREDDRLADAVGERIAARRDDALDPLVGQPAAVTSSLRLRLLVATARYEALDQTDAAGFAALIPEADAITELYGMTGWIMAVQTRTAANLHAEARACLRGLLAEFPGAVRDPEVVGVAVVVELRDLLPGLDRPAWSAAKVDPARARAVAAALQPWLPSRATLAEVLALRWSGFNRSMLRDGLVTLARARAAQGDLAGADEALDCAARVAPDVAGAPALERATLLLAQKDPARAREALRGVALPPALELRSGRVLRLAAVEEALAAGDVARARGLAAALEAEELEAPARGEDDDAAAFLELVQAARRRADR